MFLRASGRGPGWVAAVTDRYKLVLTPEAEPVLFDLELDPDEVVNRFESMLGRRVLEELAGALVRHHEEIGEPFLDEPSMQRALAAAMGD